MSSIASTTIESLEDEFSGKFCKCGHLLSEHFSWECRALDFNGTVWVGCDCTKPVPNTFEIKFYVTIEFQTTESDSNNIKAA